MESIADQEKPKRKTRTSAKAVQRYQAKTYSQIAVRIKKELAAEFDKKLKENGDTKASIIREAIESYIENN